MTPEIDALHAQMLAACDDIAASAPDDPVQKEAAAALRRFAELSMRHAELVAESLTIQRELAELNRRFRQLGLARAVAPAGRQ